MLSLVAMAFGYGFASHARGWFPKSYMEKAWQQAYAAYHGWPSHRNVNKKVYNTEGGKVLHPEGMQQGLTLVTSLWRDSEAWRPGLKLITREGDIIHEWSVEGEKVFETEGGFYKRDPSQTDIHGSYLLPNGNVIVNFTYVGTARIDACGDVVWTLKEGQHHSVTQDEDGSFWFSAVSREKMTRSERYPSGFPGLDSPVWVDRVLHVSPDGEILDDISVLDVLYENNLERFIPKLGLGKADVTHLNDVEPLPSDLADEYPLFKSGDLLLSLHHINLVLVLGPGTKKVKWHATGPFILQHDPDWIGGGWIGIFDNNHDESGGKMLGGSRVVGIQPHTDSTRILFRGDHLDRFYTSIRGKWEQLRNGNMLLTESEAGRVVEVGPSGRLTWEWIHPGYGSDVPSVTKASRHDLTRQEVSSWPCSSVNSLRTSNQSQKPAP
jgi:hypothetical protein